MDDNIDDWPMFFMACFEEKEQSCECKEFYKDFMDYTLTFLSLGNICLKSRREVTVEDEIIVECFDVDNFYDNLSKFYSMMGYVERGGLGDYLCKKCKRNYHMPTAFKMSRSFRVMGLCYKEIV